MNAAPTTTPVAAEAYSERQFHTRLAVATRKRRQATGMYKRPTKAQKEAVRRLSMRGGYTNMTPEDMLLLSTHPHFAQSQRDDYAKRYAEATAAK